MFWTLSHMASATGSGNLNVALLPAKSPLVTTLEPRLTTVSTGIKSRD